MSLYVVKRDGKFLCFNDFSDPQWDEVPDIFDKGEAESLAEDYRGHAVELEEKPAPVVVNAEEAEMLERLRTDENASPAGAIRNYFWSSVEGQNVDNKPRWSRENEARLMRAYVNGYFVANEKKYNVKVPHTKFYYWKWKPNEPGVGSGEDDDVRGVEPYRFTLAEIEHYDLQDCERKEVTEDDEQS